MSNESVVKKVKRFVSGLIFLASLCVILVYAHQKSTVVVCFYDGANVEHEIAMPRYERDILRAFMHQTFFEDSFAYTAIGDKPSSCAGEKKQKTIGCKLYLAVPILWEKPSLLDGWEVWKKYKDRVPSNCIWIKNFHDFDDHTSLIMVHKNAFLNLVHAHKNDFEIFSNVDQIDLEFTEKNAFEELCTQCFLGEGQTLMGLALGYGKENAQMFDRMCKLRKPPMEWVWSGEEIEQSFPTLEYKPPSFAGNPNSAESIALKHKYLESRKRILHHYHDRDFLEATLSLLARG